MKKIVIIIALLVGLLGGYYIYSTQTNNTAGRGNQTEVEGTIISVNTEQAMVDGPTVVEIETQNKEIITILVPSMGLPLCKGYENIADGFSLQTGDQIAVRGHTDDQGRITPCDQPQHKLEVIHTNQQGKIDPRVACESALAYMTFPSGEEADIFIENCVAGQHPEVIERYLEGLGLDGASV